MNPFEMVIGIVLICAIASVLKARYGIGSNRHGDDIPIHKDDGDARRVNHEMAALKDRIAVLERIVTDGDRNRSLALEQEIEALRIERKERQ
jgi:hypothetical protein